MLTIASTAISSAIFAGNADPKFREQFTKGWQWISKKVNDLVNSVVSLGQKLWAEAKKGWEFFKQWWKDDPVGATAGAAAAVLAIGVVIVVGGSAVGAVTGGIATLAGIIGSVTSSSIGSWATMALAGLTIGKLIQFAVRGVQVLWNFNWNVTDKEIKAQQEQLLVGLAGMAGSAVGSTLATLLCGIAPLEISKRMNFVKVNPMLLAKIKEATQFDPLGNEYGEIYDEMIGNIQALIGGTGRVAAQMMFLESYKNVRKWIKSAAKKSNLKSVWPQLDSVIAKWGEEGSKSWSFASAMEDWIDSIPDAKLRAFTEEAIEEFMDVCTENMMIISYIF